MGAFENIDQSLTGLRNTKCECSIVFLISLASHLGFAWRQAATFSQGSPLRLFSLRCVSVRSMLQSCFTFGVSLALAFARISASLRTLGLPSAFQAARRYLRGPILHEWAELLHTDCPRQLELFLHPGWFRTMFAEVCICILQVQGGGKLSKTSPPERTMSSKFQHVCNVEFFRQPE